VQLQLVESALFKRLKLSYDEPLSSFVFELNLCHYSLVYAAQFGRDYEQHLSFLVQCRSGFHALSAVQEAVVLQAARIAVEALRAVRGAHSNKTLVGGVSRTRT